MAPHVSVSAVKKAAREVIDLLGEYAGKHVPSREMLIDPVLYALLRGRHEKVKRQHTLPLVKKRKKAKRIDFRCGGSNPAVLEFAVRPPKGGGQLYGSQNVSELRKLTRVPKTQARLRILLLVDLCANPLDVGNLKATYKCVSSGPGKFARQAVRVVYVHRSVEASFPWRP